jgi:serine beta-lactamase-like protein LACTB
VRHYNGADFNPASPGSVIDLRVYPDTQAALNLFITDPLIAEPGTEYNYSTFGYTLAAAVMESAAGDSFHNLVQQEVSDVLGLPGLGADTMFDLQPGRVGYYDHADFFRQNFDASIRGEIINALRNNPGYKWAGGGFIATAQELARFGAAHFEAGFLSDSSFEDVFTNQSTASGQATLVGLGWRIDHDAAGRLRYHHAGSQQGARAILSVYPEQRLSVIVMSNLGSTPQDIMTPAAAIAEAFFLSDEDQKLVTHTASSQGRG